MHEQDKIARRAKENYDFYSGIEVEEIATWRGVLKAWLSKAWQIDPISRIAMTAMLVLAPKVALEKSSIAAYIAVTAICICGMAAVVLIVALTRGNHAETGAQRGQGQAQPGHTRASSR